ncbi:hypothetical protein Clacol_005579 [Clathrus columnatus]|uniref:Uncharacterized protein n=1 Tax=Clathrus columnatus TaxID=1419009 RepID=A0AAV5ACE5_9AGAM|nr:hypothetical protein Clacol_005579 [Clathrus columnatus]
MDSLMQMLHAATSANQYPKLYVIADRVFYHLDSFTEPSRSQTSITSHLGYSKLTFKIYSSKDAHVTKWYLLVSDAITALQCIREGWGPTLKDITISLASIGVNFHIFKTPPTPRPHIPIVLHPPILGYRNQNYTPTTGDYLKYVEIWNAVLKQPRCRTTLARGGILWCLAMEVLDPSSVVDLDFSQNEHIVHYPTPSNKCWETMLTKADEDILCRVYYIYTGNGEQTTQVSWWPKQNVWARKGLSTGYWTAQCKEWYQFGLKTILEGKAHL